MLNTEQKNKNILARTETNELDNISMHRITVSGKSCSVIDTSGKTDQEFYESMKMKFGKDLQSCI